MKKITLSLLAISFFMFIFCSCNLSEPVMPACVFSGNANVKTADSEYKVEVNSSIDGCIKITVLKPEPTTGLTYTYAKDTLYIEYLKLRCNAPVDYLKRSAFADVIYRALSFEKDKPLRIKESDTDTTVYIVEGDLSQILLFCDTKTGVIKRIEDSVSEISIIFDNPHKQEKPSV